MLYEANGCAAIGLEGCNDANYPFHQQQKVLNPITYFNQNNPDYFKADYWRKEFDWHVTSVRAILNNEVYLGMLIYGKQKCQSMKSKTKVKNPREEWIITENTHEPIISKELWDTAHKVLSSKRRPAKTGELQIFAGLIYCADCGHCLTYGQKQRKDGTYYGTSIAGCTERTARNTVRPIISATIRYMTLC